MRARMQVYRALSDFRHRETGIAAANTARIQDIPPDPPHPMPLIVRGQS